jgi:hypothetical protein
MNYHNDFYGPFQISEDKVYFKGIYRALDMKKDADEIAAIIDTKLKDIQAEGKELIWLYEMILDSHEKNEADYWNEMFRKDGMC